MSVAEAGFCFGVDWVQEPSISRRGFQRTSIFRISKQTRSVASVKICRSSFLPRAMMATETQLEQTLASIPCTGSCARTLLYTYGRLSDGWNNGSSYGARPLEC